MKIKFLNSRVNEHQRFEYRPRYYDERKERLDRKKALYKQAEEGVLSEQERRAMLKDQIRENWNRGAYRQGQLRGANLRVLFLLAILIALGYFVFFGLDHVDKIVEYIV